MQTINVTVPKYDPKTQYDPSVFSDTYRNTFRAALNADEDHAKERAACVKRAKTDVAFRVALVGSLRHYPGCPHCAWRGVVALPKKKSLPCDDCEHWRAAFDVRP